MDAGKPRVKSMYAGKPKVIGPPRGPGGTKVKSRKVQLEAKSRGPGHQTVMNLNALGRNGQRKPIASGGSVKSRGPSKLNTSALGRKVNKVMIRAKGISKLAKKIPGVTQVKKGGRTSYTSIGRARKAEQRSIPRSATVYPKSGKTKKPGLIRSSLLGIRRLFKRKKRKK